VASAASAAVTPSASITTPGAPTTVTAVAGNGQATVTWTAPASNGGTAVTGYNVYRGTTSGGETLLTSLGNVTSYTDTTAVGGTKYFYQVSAVNAQGESAMSAERSATPSSPITVPGAPTLNSATPSSTSVALAWSAPGSNGGASITNYKIYRGSTSGGETLLTTVGNVTSYTDSAVVSGTTYYYEVSAVNSQGEGALSGELSATVLLPAPTGLKVSVTGTTQESMYWTPSTVTGAVYDVYRGGTIVGTTSLPFYLDSGLTAGTAYTYQVRVRNAAGVTSPLSTSSSGTTVNSSTSGNGFIFGSAYNAAGRPLANVQVSISGKGVNKTVNTNADGVYKSASIKPGDYTIAITGSVTYTATVTAGQTTVYATSG
jgi:fibronectin type 3 domain-containing protein